MINNRRKERVGAVYMWKEVIFIVEIVVNLMMFITMIIILINLVKTQKELDMKQDELDMLIKTNSTKGCQPKDTPIYHINDINHDE